MNNDIQNKFDNMVEAFTKLDTDTMKKEIIEGQKKILSNIILMNQKLGINNELLLNKELADLNNIPISEKDFLEGIFVFTKSVDESLNNLFNYISVSQNK